MTVVLLDPRFPAMIPVGAVPLLAGDVSYTEEVPVHVRWIIADLGGSTVLEGEVLVTTDPENEEVEDRLAEGEELITAPSLEFIVTPQNELPAAQKGLPAASSGASATTSGPLGTPVALPAGATPSASGASSAAGDSSTSGSPESAASREVAYSGDGVVDGEIVGTDEHTVAVAGARRTNRTEVPPSVLDEIEDAVALMSRALRQGEWEQAQSHGSLMRYLKEETAELDVIVDALSVATRAGDDAAQEWLEQELCQELSDVLLQVLFHAEIANRRGSFDIGHVAGAFVAKMRSRAPYLFEDMERLVPTTEQERLWEKGKRVEREAKEELRGEAFARFIQLKDSAAEESSAAPAPAESPKSASAKPAAPAAQPAAAAASQDAPAAAEQPAQAAPAEAATKAPAAAAAPAAESVSGLAAAEDVIREARAKGLKDMDIPMDIRFPLVGLELDAPGEADQRLINAVEAFRAKIASLPLALDD